MRLGRTLGFALSFIVASATVLVNTSPAWAQLRTLPANAKRAVLNGYQYPFVMLGNERRILSPGAVIFDTHNRTIVRSALPYKANVVFTTDSTGAVVRIYLLTAQEIQRLDQAGR